ncbi:MAG: sulfatase-like hydrolase/transferase, partial [Planctomycetota bacterium]|nr:sulfatase-like hydrolase/transferase [Planctomycetota bacterium]
MSKPNFLVIMSDQHSPDAIGASGHPAVKTPALDSLENRGVTFTSAYCNYPMCTPSRASFMTGLLASDHGVWELGSSLRSDIPTWAHALRGAGYQTSISGRMHFIGP